MSSFYPNLRYNINQYNENYYIIITNKLSTTYNNSGFNIEFFVENNEKFEMNSSIYDLISSFIPTIEEKIFFSYINPITNNIEPISKKINVKANSYTTTITTFPIFN
jgi:hypothetical protein